MRKLAIFRRVILNRVLCQTDCLGGRIYLSRTAASSTTLEKGGAISSIPAQARLKTQNMKKIVYQKFVFIPIPLFTNLSITECTMSIVSRHDRKRRQNILFNNHSWMQRTEAALARPNTLDGERSSLLDTKQYAGEYWADADQQKTTQPTCIKRAS